MREHFEGLETVTSRSDLRFLRTIVALPESQRLLRETTSKLAAEMPAWFGAASLSTNDVAALQPAVRSLLEKESFLEVREDEGKVSCWALASRLEPNQATALGGELGGVLAAAFKAKAPAPGDPWELKGADGASNARFAVVKGWILLGSGQGVFEDFQRRVEGGSVPFMTETGEWAGLEMDLPRLSKMLNWRDEPTGPVAEWPRVQLGIRVSNGHLRTRGHLDFAHPLEFSSDSWKLPVSMLRDPLAAFTAVRDADVWLKRLPWLRDLGIEDWPDQLFLWTMAGPAWEQYFAAPVHDPTNIIAKVASPLSARLMSHSVFHGEPFSVRFTNQASRAELRARVPFFAPFLEAREQGSQPMLLGGLFPPRGGPPPPPALLSQVEGRTNLVLYDWESSTRLVVTNPPRKIGPRVETNLYGRPLALMQLAQVATRRAESMAHLPLSPAGGLYVPGYDWVRDAVPYLGNTITEVTQDGPTRLDVSRVSQVGLNSVEMFLLLQWLEDPAFPGRSTTTTAAPAPPARPAPNESDADRKP